MSLNNRQSLEPWLSDEVQFYQHQVDGIRQMVQMRGVILADEMGLGKSIQAIAVHCLDIKRGRGDGSLIIVCPATLKTNWEREIKRFTTLPVVVVNGTPAGRSKLIRKYIEIVGPKVLIINYEQVRLHMDLFGQMRFHAAVFDEAHLLKNPDSKRTKACLMGIESTRSMMVTGSPMLNQVNELWSLLERASPGTFGPYLNFKARYCVMGGHKGTKITGTKNEAELNGHLNTFMIRRKKADVLDLPPVQYIERWVDLTREQRSLYREAVEDLRIVTQNGTIFTADARTRFLRLKQICGTSAAFIAADASSKLDLAAEECKQLLAAGHKVVVFTQFRQVMESYARRINPGTPMDPVYPLYMVHGDIPVSGDNRSPDDPHKRWSRQETVDAWSEWPQAGVIICTYGAAGVGLNMQAARHGQRLDKLFVPDLNQQAVDRMHRIGQGKQPVQVFDYLVANSVEERVELILAKKSRLIGKVVEGQDVPHESFFKQLIKQELQGRRP